MSFLSELKNQIIAQPQKSACCRRAMISGILYSKGYIKDGKAQITLENSEVIEYTAALIRDLFTQDVIITTSNEGGRRKLISFKSPAIERYLLSRDDSSGAPFSAKCSNCQTAFFKGIFLASGRVCDPHKQYRLEIAPIAKHSEIRDMFLDVGVSFSETKRRNELILYTGNSGAAEDFFAALGMNATAFMFMNAKIESEFKNTANRIRNCETHNILRTVSAAAKCVEAIEALEKANLLSSLPEELEKTARLRLQFKDYSLTRLAAEFTPTISKPGLSHRLNKIVEIAENLLKNK